MATQIARGEMLHNLLIEELNHRVKNTLAVLQSIATQTFRSASRAEREKFEGRLGALAEAHNLLSQSKSGRVPSFRMSSRGCCSRIGSTIPIGYGCSDRACRYRRDSPSCWP